MTRQHTRVTSISFAMSCAVAFGMGPIRAQDNGTEAAALSLPAEDNAAKPAFAESYEPAPVPLVEAVRANHSKDRLISGAEISAIPKRFQYTFRLNMRGVYDDNIFLNKTKPVQDLYFAFEPGISIGFGDIVGRERNSIRFDYAPSILLYASHSNANAIQQLMRLEGQYRFGHLSLGLTQDVLLLEGANPASITSGSNTIPTVNLDSGGNTEVNTYTTNATFNYDLTGKTFLSGGGHYTVNDYQTLISSRFLSGDLFINYTYSPKLVVGLGGTVGYNWVDFPSPNQSFEQLNARLSYQISGKVSLNGSAGVEFRQVQEGPGGSSNVSPVYELGATYQPFDGTTVTLNGRRRTENSAVLVGQDYASTNITLSVRQRFLRRIYLGVAAGYENSDYFTTLQFADASRRDNYFFLQPAVDVTLTRFWTLGVYYLHRQNNSSSPFFTFYDNQIGLRTSLTF